MVEPRVAIGAESLRAAGSGIGCVARLMTRALAETFGKSTPVFALALNGDADPGISDVRVRCARGSRLRFLFEIQRAALGHSHFFYDFAGMARAHSRIPGLQRPYACWAHGIEVWEDARIDRLAALRRAELLFVNTRYTKERAARLHAGFERAHVCWLATETDAAPDRIGISEGPPTILVLSRIDDAGGYKGHRELIDAMPTVVRAVPAARLLIAGAGPGSDVVRSWVHASTARASIEMLGFVPEFSIAALWSRTTVFAMPSRGEGFGLAYIEAMRHGVPVIGSVHDAASEVNVEGVTGYNVDLDRRDQLAERLIALLRTPDLARTQGQAGHARWKEHFTYSAFARRFIPLAKDFVSR